MSTDTLTQTKPISLTQGALNQLRRIHTEQNLTDDHGLRIEKAHAIYLLGMEIDWIDGLNNRGFTFSNPNAKETCGCGTSFSA